MPKDNIQDEQKEETTETPEYVRVKKEKLEELVKRLERLESSASKARLFHYDEKQPKKDTKIIRLLTMDGKVIVGWERMPKNTCEKNERGVWYEDQTIKVNYENGTSEEMPYIFFTRRYRYMDAEVVSETKNMLPEVIESQGEYTFKVKTDDAEYEIGSLFVN